MHLDKQQHEPGTIRLVHQRRGLAEHRNDEQAAGLHLHKAMGHRTHVFAEEPVMAELAPTVLELVA